MITVQCLNCNGIFWVDDTEAPTEVELTTAIPCFCPYCNKNRYARVCPHFYVWESEV